MECISVWDRHDNFPCGQSTGLCQARAEGFIAACIHTMRPTKWSDAMNEAGKSNSHPHTQATSRNANEPLLDALKHICTIQRNER